MKPEIYSQFSKTEKGSVVEFSKYLHENYGMSMNELKRRFNRLKQELHEGENEFFLRVIKEYFNAKSIVRPASSGTSSESSSYQEFDLQEIYTILDELRRD